ncbi:MAG: hypothetical protein JST66_13205 [Bacteroidetes bacterium]|nr:hypothetical protein [Bacteroidota bacterium]
MADHKLYPVLRAVSDDIARQGAGNAAFYSCMWRNCAALIEAIESDMARIFDANGSVVSVQFFTDDPDYRQSSNGAVFMMKFDADPELQVRVECIIDHSRAWLKIVRQPEQAKFRSVVSSIEQAYNSEFNAELKQIAL